MKSRKYAFIQSVTKISIQLLRSRNPYYWWMIHEVYFLIYIFPANMPYQAILHEFKNTFTQIVKNKNLHACWYGMKIINCFYLCFVNYVKNSLLSQFQPYFGMFLKKTHSMVALHHSQISDILGILKSIHLLRAEIWFANAVDHPTTKSCSC